MMNSMHRRGRHAPRSNRPPGPLLRYAYLSVVLLTAGCTDLGAVRNFARLSADTASYHAIFASYASYPERARRYGQDVPEVAVVRQGQAARLLMRQIAVTSYMDALGSLAGDDAVRVETGPLVDAIGKATKFDGSTVGAAKSIADLLTRAIVGGWRQREVMQMIGDGNTPIQDVLDALAEVVQAIGSEDRQELLLLEDHYDDLRVRSRDRAGIASSAEWREYREAEVAARGPGREAYSKAIARIKAGHQLLYDNRGHLSLSETIRQVQLVEADLAVLARLLNP